MNIFDKIIMNLYLKRFPEKPFEQKPKIEFPEHQPLTVRTVHGVCFYPERSIVNGFVDNEKVCRSIVESMVPELAKCLGKEITMESQDQFGTLRIQGTLDVVLDSNIKFGDF